MIPDRMISERMLIEEMRRRERDKAWEPIPLHAPTPMPYRPEPGQSGSTGESSEERDGGTVIIIDLVDYSETRL